MSTIGKKCPMSAFDICTDACAWNMNGTCAAVRIAKRLKEAGDGAIVATDKTPKKKK